MARTSSPEREAALLAAYRDRPPAQRRAIAAKASPELRAQLARLERTIAMDASPGAMAAILTERREMQARHLHLIDQAWIDMAEGRADRVMITMPPRHGKSRRASRWAPLWYLRQHPDRRVMIASYSGDLAEEHSRWIRDAIEAWGDDLGIHLNPSSRAAMRFDIAGHQGGLVAAGIGGSLTGKGATIALVDDPVQDMASADSPAMRRKTWEWWQSVLQTRLEPDGAICVIQTRWNEDDLAGRILADAQANEWKIINLHALADSDTDPLGRALGEPLWPERFDAEHHAITRRRVGERVWAALYQQKPRPPEGGVWQRAWITDHRLTTVEFGGLDMARVIVAVDPAGGESAIGDETGIIGAARGYDGHLYVLEDRSGSMGANDWGPHGLPARPRPQGRRDRGRVELRRRHGPPGVVTGVGAAAPRGLHERRPYASRPRSHRQGGQAPAGRTDRSAARAGPGPPRRRARQPGGPDGHLGRRHGQPRPHGRRGPRTDRTRRP